MTDILFAIYPWVKSLHIMAVISWMAGLFYLPRLFVYHVEKAQSVDGAEPIFFEMEDEAAAGDHGTGKHCGLGVRPDHGVHTRVSSDGIGHGPGSKARQ